MIEIMTSLEQYRVLSNREIGKERADLLMKLFDDKKNAIIIKLKYAKDLKQVDAGCDVALQQIKENHYKDEHIEVGYENIMEYGICFHKKKCKIKCKTI